MPVLSQPVEVCHYLRDGPDSPIVAGSGGRSPGFRTGSTEDSEMGCLICYGGCFEVLCSDMCRRAMSGHRGILGMLSKMGECMCSFRPRRPPAVLVAI